MNVAELKELLAGFDDDLEVKFAYNYGDHWNTTVAEDIGDVDVGKVIRSEYHSMDKVVGKYDDCDSDDVRSCLIIQG